MRNLDTFFTGYRRETIIDGASILCNKAGEKRTKLSMRIPLSGDQLVGMPTWISSPFDVFAKPENAGKSWGSSIELDPMRLHIFAYPDADKEAIEMNSVRMTGFRIEHDAEEDLVLAFTAYLPRTGSLLKFADDHFDKSIFIKYEAMQPELLDTNPNNQPTADARGANQPDGDDEFEEERREAVSRDHDPEFPPPAKTKKKPSAPAKRSAHADATVQ